MRSGQYWLRSDFIIYILIPQLLWNFSVAVALIFPAHSQLIPAILWTSSNSCFHYQVVAVQEEASRLQGSYAGDKAREIQDKEDEVLDAWKRLNWRVKQRTERLHDADDLYRFLLAVQDQMLWMNDMLKQILTYEKAKWVFPPFVKRATSR